jgi:PadR family transcriptional regulator PadR
MMSDMVPARTTDQRDSDLLRGVLGLCVLALLETTPVHAYGVVERLRAKGFAAVGYGTIYPLVTRLRGQGLVEEVESASPVGPARKVLSVTPRGREALVAWRSRWEQNVAATRSTLAELDGERAQ